MSPIPPLLLFFLLVVSRAENAGKFLLKKNQDGTYLLVPAPANASETSTVDIKSLPPITVEDSSSGEAPGVNSQSPAVAALAKPPATPVGTPVNIVAPAATVSEFL